jgi:hypothetical protein
MAAPLGALAFMEWLLFELLRMAYRPSQDMLTFLGAEKYGVRLFKRVMPSKPKGLLFFHPWNSALSSW